MTKRLTPNRVILPKIFFPLTPFFQNDFENKVYVEFSVVLLILNHTSSNKTHDTLIILVG